MICGPRSLGAALVASALLVACREATTPKHRAIAISVAAQALALTQGASATTTVRIQRTDFDGAVDLTISGLPDGVTASFQPATATVDADSSVLTLSAIPSAAPGRATVVVHAAAGDLGEQTATLSVDVAVAGTYSLALPRGELAVFAGASDTTAIAIDRQGGFGGTVVLSVTGAPPGVTATVAPANTTGSVGTLSVVVSGSAAADTTTLTIHGTSVGTMEQTATIPITVLTNANTTQISLDWRCLVADAPAWFVYRYPGGSWSSVTPNGTTYAFRVTDRFAVALVHGTGPYAGFYGFFTVASLAYLNGRSCPSVATSNTGSAVTAGLGSSTADVEAFPSSTTVVPPDTAFMMYSLPNSATDLLAVRRARTATGWHADRMIVRRGATFVNGGTIPTLDFAGGESFAPATATYSVSGAGSDALRGFGSVGSADGSSANTFDDAAGPDVVAYGIPSARLAAGDLHRISITASPVDTSDHSTRAVDLYQHVLSGTALALPPVLAVPTVGVASSEPRVQLALQPEYDESLDARFSDGGNAAELYAVPGYFPGMAAWDVAIPDLSTITGWRSAWGRGAPISWQIQVTGGVDYPIGQVQSDGSLGRWAFRWGSTSGPSSAAARMPIRNDSPRWFLGAPHRAVRRPAATSH